MKSKFRYDSIFMYSSLQFCGHIEEYFSQHTKKLVVYVVMPRLRNKFNIIRLYQNSKLIEEKKVISSDNPLLYYFYWYVGQMRYIFKYFNTHERFILLSGHPISFFGIIFFKLFFRITTVYWMGDYFPPLSLLLRSFERIKKHYHDRADFRYYLSDYINIKLNETLLNDSTHRTLMWGVSPSNIEKKLPRNRVKLLFIGLIKKGQGLEKLLLFLRSHRQFFLTIIGICDVELYKKYLLLIDKYKITKQVFFPNEFYSDDELQIVASKSHVGIALYDISPLSSAYYTDPGKVKAYMELGLPVVMSNTTAISHYIKKYAAGEVVGENQSDIEKALIQIQKNYHSYVDGIKKFNSFFDYNKYYKRAFKPLEYI